MPGHATPAAALSFTLCKATPRGEAALRNPLWPFETRLGLPRVALQSEPIVQLDLPDALRVFVADTALEPEPLTLTLERETQRLASRELRVYLGGAPTEWEFLAWRLRGLLERWSSAGVTVRLVVPARLLSALGDSQRDELAALIAYCGCAAVPVPGRPRALCGGYRRGDRHRSPYHAH